MTALRATFLLCYFPRPGAAVAAPALVYQEEQTDMVVGGRRINY